MFVGRISELKFLNDCYNKDGFGFIPIYGRRRVGKTELIHEFTKDKKSIIYSATEQSAYLSLVQFSNAVFDFFDVHYFGTFEQWDQLFEFIGSQDFEGKLILVIDEYPYLAKQSPELSSILQKHMDHTFKEKNIMVILCGSSMSFMENQVLGYESPLYGRRTGQIKLKPFDYNDAGAFISKKSNVEKFLLYSIAGGIPQYLKILTSYETLDEGIIKSYFETTGHLYEEPANLLKQELREPSNYFSIITAIASGKSKSNEIATTTGIEVTSLGKYLRSLQDLGIVEKQVPMGKILKKRGIYRLADNCFAFWFRFVITNKTAIDYGKGKEIWESLKDKALPTYQGRMFEKAAATYLLQHPMKDGLYVKEIGTWWGTNPILKKQEEIDIVAECSKKTYIFGECKWRQEKTGLTVLKDLMRKSDVLYFAEKKYFCIFSRKGFTDELISYANAHEDVKLVSLDDMYST